MLELVNIIHNYDGQRLLDGISFSVADNEVLCLLGSSGSGKSTILRIIAGLENPLSGKVLYNGRNIINDPVHKRNFGFVFQDYALFPHMSVYENIAFGLKMKGIKSPDLDRFVSSALKQVGMDSFAQRKVTELSGGEQQRVALARSLVVQPSLLMLDEPLGALDYSLRQTLIAELKEILGKNGLSAVYVTHDQNEAMSLADRIAILHDGRIIQTDTPEALFAHPVNKWCAEFLGFHNFVGCERFEGYLKLRNFEHTVKIPDNRNERREGKTAEVLLKDGLIFTGSDQQHFCFMLDAIVVQRMYRGNYYDTQLKINNETDISVRTSRKYELNSAVKIGFAEDSYIVY